MKISSPIQVAIAGSTNHSLAVAQALADDVRFKISWILTPEPKKVGRKQEIINNPVHQWVISSGYSFQLIKKKISQLDSNFLRPDFLLVVDFGYIIPDWLLSYPKITTLNLHPSALPRWRGSSPGQFVLLSGDSYSAVSLIKLTSQLDTGPVINQEKFIVNNDWTSTEYYQHSFKLASEKIADWIENYYLEEKHEITQPEISPTPIARKICKDDAFVPWKVITSCMQNQTDTSDKLEALLPLFPEKSILFDYFARDDKKSWSNLIERASRAFQPWPILWTVIPTNKGTKRMQILDCVVKKKSTGYYLILKKIKIEGLDSTSWNEIKSLIKQ